MDKEGLLQKIDRLPRNPGVYLFRNALGEILYVGKAANLYDRVHSYLQKLGGEDWKTLTMIGKSDHIDFIITDTEKEALILEDNLIKEHHPPYNVKLRDDKHYPYLRLSPEEEPALSIVRRVQKDHSLYFGPYPSATALRETVKSIRRVFPISTNLDTKFTKRLRLHQPDETDQNACSEKSAPARDREAFRQVRMFLEGRNQSLIQLLHREMEAASDRMNFEAAARFRDQIENIKKVIEKQKIVSREWVDRDAVGLSRKDQRVTIYLLFIRGGKILGGKGFSLPASGLPDEEILSAFLRQYYREGEFIPPQILVSEAPLDQSLIEDWLTGMKGKRVRILVSRKGSRKRLLEMARENAETFSPVEGETEEAGAGRTKGQSDP